MIDHAVYRFAAIPTSWHQRLLAACLAGAAVASHRSSAALWNVPGYARDVIEVTAVRHRRRKASDVIWHESRRLDPRDTTDLEHVPVTTFTRTVLDLGAVVDESELLQCFDDGVRRSLTSWLRVSVELERFGNRRIGSGTVRRVLQRRSPQEVPRGSTLETTFEQLVRDFRLPSPVGQLEICDGLGQFVARVDFAYPDLRVAIEIDGSRTHAGTADWNRDLIRQNRIVALGWRVLRFTSVDLSRRPDEVARTIASALDTDVRP